MSAAIKPDVKQWTAKRKTELVLDIIRNKTTVAEASCAYGLSPSEIENWIDAGQKGMENALCSKRQAAIEQREPTVNTIPTSTDTSVRLRSEDIEQATWQSAINIRTMHQNQDASDAASKLKKSWMGRFYVKHLKQIPIIRKLTIATWKNLYPVYVGMTLKGAAKRWYPIIKMVDYAKRPGAVTTKVFDDVTIATPTPEVLPPEDKIYLTSLHDSYVFPPVYVLQINDSRVYGKTNFVFTKDAVICHDLYNFANDYTSEELHGRHLIDVKNKRIRLLLNDSTPEHLPIAASFLDACSSNYAHWLTEVLPRITAFCLIKQYAHIPIIIDEGLHPNILESLALIVGDDREIISLPVGRAIHVDVLYMTSVTGYVPFERRNTKTFDHSHGLFSSLAFDQLRNQLLSDNDKLPLQDLPKKIYLRRASGARKITNDKEIEQLLCREGYVIVEPESFSFLQQLALFSRANEIVAPSGAALANLILTRPDTRIHILIGKYEGTSYWYWQNMACASGKQVIYSLGELSDPQSTIHSDFLIDSKIFTGK